MKFGPVPVEHAKGAMLAHSVKLDGKRLRKARVLDDEDVAALRAANISSVIVASPDAHEIEENEAAARIARALPLQGVDIGEAATGRVNFHSSHDGVFTVDGAMIDALNAVDPHATIATLEPYAVVTRGQMVATIKIIPFAMAEDRVDEICAMAGQTTVLAVHPFRPLRVGLIQTMLPVVKASVLDKTVKVLQERLRRSGSSISAEIRVPHETGPVAAAIRQLAEESDIIVIFGASALADPEADVIPAAIRASGGTVLRSGMPVDPGNLLVLAERQGKPVLGAPGCSRSPQLNGFDWVLDRLVAGIPVAGTDIAAMGVGGLLMEIPSRPQPREGSP